MKIVIHGNGLGVGCLLCKLKGICKHEQFLRSNQFFLETNQLRGHDTIYLQKPNLLQNKHFTSYTREDYTEKLLELVKNNQSDKESFPKADKRGIL